MKRFLTITFVLATASWSYAQQARVVPQEILDRIVDDDPNPLPRYLTPAERLLPLPTLTADDLQRLAPPTGTVHTPSEYDLNEGLLIRWGSYNSILTAMTVGVTTNDPDAIVYILVTGASQQSSATSTLNSAGADLSQVEFITYTSNTVWIRDYGPRFIFEDGLRAIVDHIYNRPRPLDDVFPPFLGSLWGEPVYDLPLYHGGGNFHLFSTGDAFMSSLITAENPGLSEQDVKNYFSDYLNVDLTIYTGFPSTFDSTRHIDMWMFPVRDDEIIIGQYLPSTGQPYTITENAVADLTARGYTVHRTPGWNSGGTHYTYTNAVVINDLVFISYFGGSYTTQDAQALSVYQTAFPAHQVIQVNNSDIIHAAGAMHCIVMHVPAYVDSEPVVRVVSPNGGEHWTVGQDYDITWTAHDDVGITGVDLYYSTDGGATFPHLIATDEPDDGVFTWTVPATPSAECRVKAVAHDAEANSDEDISDTDFEITLYGPQLVYSFPLDTDPGWTTEGQWAYGKPTGDGGEHGGPDPDAGHTGYNVYGYNLQGDYGYMTQQEHLTSTALDCTDLQDVTLKFWRWLGVESPQWDHAYLRASNNGTTWTTIWENAAEISDSPNWMFQEFDISSVADNQPTVYLRWTMGPTDSSYHYCGWNIDDIEIWAIAPPQDCNNNGIPDYVDISEGTSQDCNLNGIPDECDITGGTSPDLNDNGIPDECEVGPATLPEPPHDTPKNRYLSVSPNNADLSVAFQVEMTASTYFPGSVGVLGWAGEPDENDVSLITATPFFSDAWPPVLHLGDCEVVPAASYMVRPTGDGVLFADPLEVSTVAQPVPPPPRWWADVVGAKTELGWSAPDGFVNMDDIQAAIQTFEETPGAPHWTWVDLEEEVPNAVINMTDIQLIILAFESSEYPYGAPADCP